jgi:transcriptional regulator GlxA family with amidase domain
VPIDRLAEIAPACRISRARVVDAGRIVTAGGIASGMEMGFHLLRRAGYDEAFIRDVARCMEYSAAYDTYGTTSNTRPNPALCSPLEQGDSP